MCFFTTVSTLIHFISSTYHIGAPCSSTIADGTPFVSLHALLAPITFFSMVWTLTGHHRAGIMYVVGNSQHCSDIDVVRMYVLCWCEWNRHSSAAGVFKHLSVQPTASCEQRPVTTNEGQEND